MSVAEPEAAFTYLGWSGFDLRFAGAQPVLIDPPAMQAIPADRDICLLITHGHLEHVSGAGMFIAEPGRTGAASVFAAPGVCRYLRRRSRNEADSFQPCRPGESYTAGAVTIDVFKCRHASLLPPEKGGALKRIRELLSNPRLAAQIIVDSIGGPLPGPTLGFRLTAPDGRKVLFFGEGLHRQADIDDIANVGKTLSADTLIAAVEPEDIAVMPELVSATGAPTVVPYEAHAPWRQGFAMGCADLDALSSVLTARGHTIVRTRPNVPVTLPAA